MTVADNGSKVLPPDNLTATATGEPGEVFLSWENSPTSDNVTIYWTDDTSLAIDVDNVSTYDGFTVIPAPDDTVTIQGLRSGVTYNFTAVASNDGGPGNSSPEQSATTYVASFKTDWFVGILEMVPMMGTLFLRQTAQQI